MIRWSRLSLVLLAFAAQAAVADNGDQDPWQGFNRPVHAFNDWFDVNIGKPVARGYQAVTTDFIDQRVTNVFRNLGDVTNAVNLALQGEGRQSLDTVGRVLANSSLGVAGLFDVASQGGIPRRDTDFGVTLGKWGVGSGPYLVLPFLGPSTVRDTAGIPVDWIVDPLPTPLTVVDDDAVRWGLEALYLVDKRADLLAYEEAVVGDRYAFLRDIYLQNREFQVGGTAKHDPFLEDGFEDEDEDEDEDQGDTGAGEGDPVDVVPPAGGEPAESAE